jgi:hypothetical protein
MSVHLQDDVREYIRSGGGATVWVGVIISVLRAPRPISPILTLMDVYAALRREGVEVIPGNMEPGDVFSGREFYLRGPGYMVARAVNTLGANVDIAQVLSLQPSRIAALQAIVGA